MKPSIILVGAGGHARSCIEVIESEGHFKIGGLIGMPQEVGNKVCGYAIIDTDESLVQLKSRFGAALVCIGQIRSPEPRIRIFELLKSMGYLLPTAIASTAMVSNYGRVGDGTVVMHRAIVNAGARIGVNAIINTASLIEHDAVVEDHCHISTGAIVNGGARIGVGCFIGSGAVILEGVTVGSNSIIGAQALVVKDVPSGAKIRHEVC